MAYVPRWLILVTVITCLLASGWGMGQGGYLCLGGDGHVGFKETPDNPCSGHTCATHDDDRVADQNPAERLVSTPHDCGQCIDIPLVTAATTALRLTKRGADDWTAAAVLIAATVSSGPTRTADAPPPLIPDRLSGPPAAVTDGLRAAILLI